ncbi:MULTISPECIES: alpha/beta hydrolase fold domain-containing protein [unclassified Nonomuraea]|uniref:alpha/beta hydrolase fold domain-containing protein n=1 Tax=unclassified Nonomuraea TaxID=2593643 RepID=UPI0033E1F290
MISLPAWLMERLVRLALKSVMSSPLPLRLQRAWVAMMAWAIPVPAAVHVRRTTLGHLDALEVTPPAEPTGTVLFLHGGGFVAGTPRLALSLAAHLALAADVAVFLPHYRRAPEHPYPVPAEDASDAYCALLACGKSPDSLVIAGDSSGAALALEAAMRARDLHARPAAVVLLSPWTATAVRHSAVDPVISQRALRLSAALYRAGASPEQVSPALRPLAGLPTLIIYCGEREILRDQARALAERARTEGVPVTYRFTRGMWHDFYLFASLVPEGRAAIHELADVMGTALATRRAHPDAAG